MLLLPLMTLLIIEKSAVQVIRAATPGTYVRTCTPCKDSDETVHSHSLIRIFTGCILDSQW